MNTLVGTLMVLGGLGLFFGVLLSLAGLKLKTRVDPRLESLKDILPGVNCGGCGCAGCNAFAEDVYFGKAEPDGCPVGGDELNQKIAGIIGVEIASAVRKTAYVKCIGNDRNALFLFNYQGVESCRAAVRLVGGGSKGCTYGCLGGGSCKKICVFDAINIIDGIAVIDNEKCTACTACVAVCPKNLIEMIPAASTIRIGCNARDGGKIIRQNCEIGCIGCRLCVKVCPKDAIEMDGALARISYEKCDNCGTCADKCSRRVIEKG
ncbi:MAG: RnfABCDGE type electron transport complex subunit B [Defluviitaleaceae bacterium]|nr:RnfABCDGE type electron transport complex subunit B [Defluviitaleaceae bacterium]MCL2274696.1 RnfABCDGE type electron transport complex subunit B [Defluviitaleaceae bacterium]